MRNKYLIYIIIFGVFIISTAIGFFIGFENGKTFQKNKFKDDLVAMQEQIKKDQQAKQSNDNSQTNNQNQNQDQENTPPIKSSGVNASDIEWLPNSIKLQDLKILSEEEEYIGSSIDYYQVAKIRSGGNIILALLEGMGTSIFRFIEKNNEYYYLDTVDNFNTIKFNKKLLNKIFVEPNYNNIISVLIPPEIIKINNVIFKKFPNMLGYVFLKDIGDINAYKKIATTEFGDFYVNENKVNLMTTTKVKSISYFIELKDKTLMYYEILKDFLADDGSLLADLTDKSFANRRFNKGFTFGGGCGRGTNDQTVILKNPSNRLTQIGLTPTTKSPLFTLKNKNDELLKIAYDGYRPGRENQEDFLSFEDFAAKKPLLIWQDPLGNYLIFIDADFDTLAECAKPVIYLYPENPTKISIKVGADIKLSEPLYQNGWNVFAYPDGTIINSDGTKWDSLFWEGKGYGQYPQIKYGKVVPRENIKNEIEKDLKTFGLNQKEINDFMEFWLPLMPNDPYIRLTWLGTRQMQILAPLDIKPYPDTLIRVFLDFQGQSSPDTNLKPQQLQHYQRKGFTVVEWGGLLISR